MGAKNQAPNPLNTPTHHLSTKLAQCISSSFSFSFSFSGSQFQLIILSLVQQFLLVFVQSFKFLVLHSKHFHFNLPFPSSNFSILIFICSYLLHFPKTLYCQQLLLGALQQFLFIFFWFLEVLLLTLLFGFILFT